ncbi:type II CAAX endopeptidase family protein [Flavobacteriaceae bacterium 3-367]|uniref:CPBP family intramembrane glutamic endopeptidase n=1 Tax=Eudoraea algarum TaxID=3417568 RepID=UPI00328B9374
MESKLSENKTLKERLQKSLLGHPYLPLWEILLVAGTVIVFMVLALPLAKGNLLAHQGIVWLANILMMVLIGLGLWLRGTGLSALGLHLRFTGWKNLLRTLLWSALVFVVTVFCFVMGEVILRGLVASGEPADMTGYAYLKDNPGLLILSLLGVYIVSSFGEELVYRGFLIHRISELFGHSRHKNALAVLLSGLIFGLAHYQWGLTGVVQTTIMGWVLGLFYLLFKKRLIVLILAHVFMDTLLLLGIYFGL